MFTGIIEELGTVQEVKELSDSIRLTIQGPGVTADARVGDSIAANGVCLTVVGQDAGCFTADVMAETLNRSSLGSLEVGERVNLERPLRLGGRIDGHLVQGHVDGVGTITDLRSGGDWRVVQVAIPRELTRYLVRKGSITIDGISLTVSDLTDDPTLSVSLIPATLSLTTLGTKKVGELVNLEVDVIAKYVERMMGERS